MSTNQATLNSTENIISSPERKNSNQINLTSILNPTESSIEINYLEQNNNGKRKSDSKEENEPTTLTDDNSLKENNQDDINAFNDDNESITSTSTSKPTSKDSEESLSSSHSSKLPPRKRSKVSRACDECRRKKIKCDAVFDISLNKIVKMCTNCEKNNYKCTFTRVPLKRGPNKGYTKKLNSTNNVQQPSQSRKSSNKDLPVTPQSPNFPNITTPYDLSSRTNSNNTITPHLQQAQSQSQPQTQSQQLPILQPFPTPQVILPPLSAIPLSDRNNSSNTTSNTPINTPINSISNSQPTIFWKVPTEMPNLQTSTANSNTLHLRKGSVDSTHSSLSSVSSNMIFNPNSKPKIKGSVSSYAGSIENSDSEDEFLSNNSSRLSRSTFQVPFTLPQNKSPNVSFSSDRDPQRSRESSIISLQSINSPHIRFNNPSIAQKNPITKESLNILLSNYYSLLYPQYPILPNPEIMRLSIDAIIENPDFSTVIELFYIALNALTEIVNSFVSITTSTGTSTSGTTTNTNNDFLNITSMKFAEIARAFEILTSLYITKSFIHQSVPAKIILTSTLVLLNYSIVLSGFNYSLGFGIAFSYFKDWLIFKEGYESPCFANLIQLVVLDSLHTLYYGLPRSSTVCFAIDTGFIDTFLKNVEFASNVDFEWLSIGLHLVVLNNDLQELDTLNKLESIVITGTQYKFMTIIKLYYDLFIYFKNLNNKLQNLINSNKDTSLDEVLKSFIYNVELDLAKITKKLTNLIDEQLDDIELTKPNPLIPLILIKCIHISISSQVFIESILHLNGVLDFSNGNPNNNRSKFNKTNARNGFNGRKRSDSDASITSMESYNYNTKGNISDFSNVLGECNKRYSRLDENVINNINRCASIKQLHQHSNDIISLLVNSKRQELNVPRTSTNSGKTPDYSVVIQNWVRMVNVFFSGEITREGINGWSCI